MHFAPSLLTTLVLAATAAAQSFDFLPAEVQPSADFAVGITDADLNNDQVPDLLVVSHCPPRAICLFNDGAGHFYFAGDIPLPIGARAADVVKGDLDGDGQLDAAIANRNSGTIGLLPQTGGGAFGPAQLETTGGFPVNLVAADFDANLRPDLATACALTAVNTHLNVTGAVQLSQTGTCPGPVTIDLSGATPNSTVEVWLAQAGGRTPLPSGHACSGVLTGLDATLRLAGTLTTGPTGAASQSVSLPPGACGRLVQVVDPGACAVSNVWLLR